MSRLRDSRRPLVWVAQGYWVDPIFRGIAAFAAEHDWVIDAGMRWRRGPITPPSPRPDGVIVFTGDTPGLESVVRSLDAPVVDIENYADRYGAPKVVGDDNAVGRLAARHLADGGPSRLLFLNPSETSPVARERMAGFRAEAAAAGIPVEGVTLDRLDPRALVEKGPVAIFAGGDEAALAVMRLCLDAGVAVPEDVAILGADDTEYICDLAPVALSSVAMDFEEKGRRAAELLDRLMRGETAPERPVIVPPSGITARTSTQVVRTGHPALDRLLRHFRENSHRPVGLGTLCAECGLPLRTAQHLMRARLNSTPAEVLTRLRLRNAERLAKNRRLTRDAVARAAGFGGRAALARACKNASAL